MKTEMYRIVFSKDANKDLKELSKKAPLNRNIYYSAYYELNDNFRNLLDDCMRTAKSMHVRDLTISVGASRCASFFEYLQKLGLKDIYDIQIGTCA